MRNYKKEYAKFQSSKKSIKDRSKRNRARRTLMQEGLVHKNDRKDVDHKDGNPQNNSRANLKVLSRSKNRAKK